MLIVKGMKDLRGYKSMCSIKQMAFIISSAIKPSETTSRAGFTWKYFQHVLRAPRPKGAPRDKKKTFFLAACFGLIKFIFNLLCSTLRL